MEGLCALIKGCALEIRVFALIEVCFCPSLIKGFCAGMHAI